MNVYALAAIGTSGDQDMRISSLLVAPAVSVALLAAAPASAQTQPAATAPPAPPTFATTKVEGTDNVYIFR
jgi:hypothetical protein